MKISVVDAIVERRECQRRKIKTRHFIFCIIKVIAVIVVLFSFVMSLVNLIERFIKSKDQRKKRWNELTIKIKSMLPKKKCEDSYYFESFNEKKCCCCEDEEQKDQK